MQKADMEPIEYDYLVNSNIDFVDEIAGLKRKHWLHTSPDRPKSEWKQQIVNTKNKEVLPITFIATDEDKLCGFVTVVSGLMSETFPKSVWLITLYLAT